MTALADGNKLFRNKEYEKAIERYLVAGLDAPKLQSTLRFNLSLAISRSGLDIDENIIYRASFSEISNVVSSVSTKGQITKKAERLIKPNNLEDFYFKKIKESELFDLEYYRSQCGERLAADDNPLQHFLEIGINEGLNPSPSFNSEFYKKQNPDVVKTGINPFIHYVCNGRSEGRDAVPQPYKSRYEVAPVEYIPRVPEGTPPPPMPVKPICFYLPQFHAIPENDEWWGKGFTEWTNVKPAKPQFEGHYQPHVPHEDIGYYNLLDRETQAKQIELAKQYGIGGFCYYLYWFSGKRLLEQPLDNMLADPTLDFPFCVCWANENWSRRWDGLDHDLLMVQDYSDDDDIAFITNISKYLKDERYIRIEGKPLLVIYRPNLFPDMKATAARWRRWCRENGVGEIYLAYPQSFEVVDPATYDFDAALEFPPNNSKPPNISNDVTPVAEDFQSKVYDWRIFVERSENYIDPGYTLFRSATPAWDNTARKKNKGTVFHNSCPKLFTKYLENAFSETLVQRQNPDERLVFINAWNEWAEGAHLEPDERYGYAWLQSVRDAHKAISDKNKRHNAIYETRWNKLNSLFGEELDRERFGFLVDYESLLKQGRRHGLNYCMTDGAPSFVSNGSAATLACRESMSRIAKCIYGGGTYCFVVLQYNKSKLTIECVKSISRLENGEFDVKIVIVDNGSERDHVEAVEQEFSENPDIVILRSDVNRGFSGGNNIGYRFAKNELNAKFCVVINNDTEILQRDFISRSVTLFDDHSYSVLGPDVCVGDSRHENPWNDYIYSTAEFGQLRDMRAEERKEYLESQKASFEKIGKSTASSKLIINPLLQGAAFIVSPIYMADRESLFDERLFLYGEEFLLAVDCLVNGDLCLYSSELKIEHHEGASTDELPSHDKMMLGYDSAIKSMDICLLRLERRRNASLGKVIHHTEKALLKDLVAPGGRHVLVDLLFCQPGYHGGGEYGKAVFKKLAEGYAVEGGFELWVAMNPSLFIDQWVWDLCKQYGINVISVKTYDDIIELVNEDIFSTFYTPAIVVYTGYEYMKRSGEKLPFTCNDTKVIGTLHDIRDFELASDHEKILSARKKAGCKYESSMSPAEWDASIKKNSEMADELRRMYANIISDSRVHLITISKYCEKSIQEKIGVPANPMKAWMSPMKSRPLPIRPDMEKLGVDDGKFALILHASRFEKNAASAIRAFDDLFSDELVPSDFKVVLTGITTIDQVGMKAIRNRSRFIPVGEVKPETLEYFFKTARLLVYPSFNEGLGYPPIEAMSYSTPCAVSSVTAIPEVCGAAVDYFDPFSVPSIKETVVASLNRVHGRAFDVLERFNKVKYKQEQELESLYLYVVGGE